MKIKNKTLLLNAIKKHLSNMNNEELAAVIYFDDNNKLLSCYECPAKEHCKGHMRFGEDDGIIVDCYDILISWLNDSND